MTTVLNKLTDETRNKLYLSQDYIRHRAAEKFDANDVLTVLSQSDVSALAPLPEEISASGELDRKAYCERVFAGFHYHPATPHHAIYSHYEHNTCIGRFYYNLCFHPNWQNVEKAHDSTAAANRIITLAGYHDKCDELYGMIDAGLDGNEYTKNNDKHAPLNCWNTQVFCNRYYVSSRQRYLSRDYVKSYFPGRWL